MRALAVEADSVTGKDRRGLPEIVAFTGTMLAVAGVLVAQIATGHEASRELMAAFVALVLVVSARGTQSAMERGASSEHRNHESTELRKAVEDVRREAAELRSVNEINRNVMLLQAAQTVTTAKKEG